jgi:hypothetical protein
MIAPLPPLDEATLQDITGLHARLKRLVGQYATKTMGPLERDALGKECLRISDRLEKLGFKIDPQAMILTAGPTGPSVA